MGSRTGISEEEYLHTSYEYDRDYRDGETEERGLPDYPHSKAQFNLTKFFAALQERFPIFPAPEIRMKLRPGRFLVADLAVFWPEKPPRIPETPPLVAVEILSPEDRLARVLDKLEEYKNWGVPHVWFSDPRSRRMYSYDGGLIEKQTLPIPELGVELTGADSFD